MIYIYLSGKSEIIQLQSWKLLYIMQLSIDKMLRGKLDKNKRNCLKWTDNQE